MTLDETDLANDVIEQRPRRAGTARCFSYSRPSLPYISACPRCLCHLSGSRASIRG